MRYAFTILELLLVITIIGILTAIGVQVLRPKHLLNDANFIKIKIMKTQSEGLFFDTRSFDGSEISSTRGCITLDKNNLNDSAKNGKVTYSIHSSIEGDLAGKRLCFDYLGRPALDNHNNLLNSEANLTLKERNRAITLSLEPISGYVIIH